MSVTPFLTSNAAEVTPGPDRRASPRYSAEFTARCRFVESHTEEEVVASVRDISLTGIRLFLQAPIEPDTILSIELPIGGNLATQAFRARVRHIKQVSGGGWMAGCEFTAKLKDYLLRALLKRRFVSWQTPPKKG
jgi:PilZ domain